MKRTVLFFIFSCFLSISFINASTINIAERGAVGDGITDNTEILQKAIDDCASVGGGTVLIPAGKFLIRPVELRSVVNINISQGGVLLGSTIFSDYDQFPALIWGRRLDNISITGSGTIDGQGGHANFQHGDGGKGGLSLKRPKLIAFYKCKNIEVSGIYLRNSASWVQHYDRCENVILRGLNIYSHCNHNNDGIDIASRNVIISDCIIDVDDDAICMKSESEEICENVTITNCIVASNCNGIKLGTGSRAGFRNITISNCVVQGASEDNVHKWKDKIDYISADKTALAGVAIEMVDGGILEGVTVSNIMMRDVQTPIFIKLGDRKRSYGAEHGILKNVNISNIIAYSQSMMSSSITGTFEADVENVQISNIQIIQPGGGTTEMFEKTIPENEKRYPENRMFGYALPAAGFYVRHVKDIRFSNIRVISLTPDKRPIFYFDDVKQGTIDQSKNDNLTDKEFIYTINCNNLSIDGTPIK